MKRILLISVLLGYSLLIYAQGYFSIKSGYIKYELTGNTTGTEELWWDDYGAKTRTLTKSTTVTQIFGLKDEKKEHKLEIRNEETLYTIDYVENKGLKTVAPYQPFQKQGKSMTEAEKKKLEEDILRSFGGKRLGKETFKGYSCEKVEVMGMQSWVYKGLTLKSAGEVLGTKLNKQFVVFEPNSRISDSKFLPPNDVDFDEVPQGDGVNPFALAMSEMDQEQSDAHSDASIKPTQYPFEIFEKKINKFSRSGYQKMMVLNNAEGVHSAVFMKGFSGSLTVIATSTENPDLDKPLQTNAFNHNGKRCYFETIRESGEASSVLLIEISKYDALIAISVSPETTKAEVLKIADEFGF